MVCAIVSIIFFASVLTPLVSPHPTESIPFTRRHASSSFFSQKLVPHSGLPVEEPLLVGSFNIQTLARKKFNNPDVMSVVEKVIRRYDLILIMEIMTETDKYMDELLADVNSGMQQEQTYDMVLSERRPETKEHYAFLYRKNKLKLISSESYTDPDDFYRKPLIAIFETSTLRDVKKFAVVGHHVKPAEAVREINGLANVYDYIKNFHEIEDVLLMGDFNADCTYVKEGDWDEMALWYRSEFTWAIPSHIGTTTNYRSCSLDRFVYTGENMNDGVILSSAGIFNFQNEYDLSLDETRHVSDHWPIEIKIRSKMSPLAEKYLKSEICFQVRDSQPRTRPANVTDEVVTKMARMAFFNVTKSTDGLLLTNKTRDLDDMLGALTRLRRNLPIVITRELHDAIKYKVSHGSLKDDSSFADVNDSGYTIRILYTDELLEASICRNSTVN